MTTAAQVRQVVQPLLARNPDLALVGRMVVIKPVRHILRGIYIDRDGSKDLFLPTWAVVHLFVPSARFSFNWGERVYRRPKGSGLMCVGDPDVSMTMAEAIEEQALPLLRPVQSLDDFVAFVSEDRFPRQYLALYPIRKIYVDIARGDLESARAICAYLASDRGRGRYLPIWQEEHEHVMGKIAPLLASDDRAALAGVLRACEAEAVRRLKLEKHWEPTPFPLEEQAG